MIIDGGVDVRNEGGQEAESPRHVAATLPLAQGNELAHAMMAHLGRAHGIRVLSIKGLVADRYGLRAPRAASDADVLVDPRQFDRFCEILHDRGWHRRVERAVPALIDAHSVTLINDTWPNDIDAHRFFPGFFADADVVFDQLWESSEDMEVAHLVVRVPSWAGTAVIGLLHALRYSRSVRHHVEYAEIREAVAHATEDERAAIVEIAAAGHAQWVLSDVIREMGMDPADDATEEQKRVWLLNRETTEDGSAVSWLEAVRNAPLRGKPAVLFNALWIPRKDIPRNDPHRVPTRREAWAHRLMRWRRGFTGLLRYVRIVRQVGSDDR